MGEYVQAFTIRQSHTAIARVAEEYWKNLGYSLRERSDTYLVLEHGDRMKNLYSFSLEKVFKELSILLVPGKGAPVTTLKVHLSVPWVRLSRTDVRVIESLVESFREHLKVTARYGPLTS